MPIPVLSPPAEKGGQEPRGGGYILGRAEPAAWCRDITCVRLSESPSWTPGFSLLPCLSLLPSPTAPKASTHAGKSSSIIKVLVLIIQASPSLGSPLLPLQNCVYGEPAKRARLTTVTAAGQPGTVGHCSLGMWVCGGGGGALWVLHKGLSVPCNTADYQL